MNSEKDYRARINYQSVQRATASQQTIFPRKHSDFERIFTLQNVIKNLAIWADGVEKHSHCEHVICVQLLLVARRTQWFSDSSLRCHLLNIICSLRDTRTWMEAVQSMVRWNAQVCRDTCGTDLRPHQKVLTAHLCVGDPHRCYWFLRLVHFTPKIKCLRLVMSSIQSRWMCHTRGGCAIAHMKAVDSSPATTQSLDHGFVRAPHVLTRNHAYASEVHPTLLT